MPSVDGLIEGLRSNVATWRAEARRAIAGTGDAELARAAASEI